MAKERTYLDDFNDHLVSRARTMGLPSGVTTPDELREHTIKSVSEVITRPKISLLPSVHEHDHEHVTVQATRQIAPIEWTDASITERGREVLLRTIERELAMFLAGQLMRSGWVDVKIDRDTEGGDVAVATLTVVRQA